MTIEKCINEFDVDDVIFEEGSSRRELFVVLDGQVDAWVDGVVYPMKAGDFAAFPAGTGICHTFINNGESDAELLVGGEADKNDNRIYYPLHPQRRGDLSPSQWWDDVRQRSLGAHDGLPGAQRGKPTP